jgi:hypothetical protein
MYFVNVEANPRLWYVYIYLSKTLQVYLHT